MREEMKDEPGTVSPSFFLTAMHTIKQSGGLVCAEKIY